MKAILLPENKLRKLYTEKLASSTKIAKKYHCDPTTIRNYLRKYHIPVRIGGPIPKNKKKPSNNAAEKSYMLGLCAADIYVRRHWRQIRIELATSIPQMIKVFKNTWGPYSKMRMYLVKSKSPKPTFLCRYLLHPAFSFLLYAKKIMPSDSKTFYAYLAGAVDGDGCIVRDPSTSTRAIMLSNMDKIWLEKIKGKLHSMGFHPTIHGGKRGKDFVLGLYRKREVLNLGHQLLRFMKYEPRKKKLARILKEIEA